MRCVTVPLKCRLRTQCTYTEGEGTVDTFETKLLGRVEEKRLNHTIKSLINLTECRVLEALSKEFEKCIRLGWSPASTTGGAV